VQFTEILFLPYKVHINTLKSTEGPLHDTFVQWPDSGLICGPKHAADTPKSNSCLYVSSTWF